MALQLSKPIYLVTDGGKFRTEESLVYVVARALDGANGGIGFVQLREKDASFSELVEDGKELKFLCETYDAKLIINRDLKVALEVKADGVHLGKEGPTIDEARSVLPRGSLVGFSAHSKEEALRALEDGADYVFISPIFSSKKNKHELLGIGLVEELSKATDKMVFALGGVNHKNIAECKKAGASGIAAISALLETAEPNSASERLFKSWSEA